MSAWLPQDESDFAAWGLAADRAYREFKAASQASRLRLGNEKLLQEAERARQLMWVTLERAYPAGFWSGMDDLKAGKTTNLEIYLAFLEADPYFFRSGYAKEDVIRHLNRLILTSVERRRLQDVVLHRVDAGFRREFRAYCRLARHVQSESWLQEVEARLTSEDPNHVLRAQWVLDACRKR